MSKPPKPEALAGMSMSARKRAFRRYMTASGSVGRLVRVELWKLGYSATQAAVQGVQYFGEDYDVASSRAWDAEEKLRASFGLGPAKWRAAQRKLEAM